MLEQKKRILKQEVLDEIQSLLDVENIECDVQIVEKDNCINVIVPNDILTDLQRMFLSISADELIDYRTLRKYESIFDKDVYLVGNIHNNH